MNPLHRQFPADFVWGVATSSFQIEGAAHEDGKGESIWDRFCKQPGAIADASNGDVACDHFHRLDSDLDLIASLGVNAYRFSIAWPRVQALGHGEFNPRGLDFYERLVDGLRQRGIQAWATLNHWDLPQGLQDRGGWNDRDTVHRFVDYARHVQARLGDRLHGITTHNEPWVIATLGHDQGNFAPGIKSRKIAAQVSHHLLLSHGLAMQSLRADGAKSQLGIVLNLSSTVPATAMPADIAAADLADSRSRRWYADPLFKGHYPADVLAELGADAPIVQAGDMAAIAQPMDYLGINYYTRSVIAASGEDWNAKGRGLPVSDMDWEIYPRGLTDLLVQMHRDYPALPPVYITENGGAFKDDALAQGRVQDDDRIAYLREHIAAVARAMQQGVPMAGYMVWSLMDNFEWASGYLKRFGIVHVDYATQARTPKASAEWYRQFLRDWRG
ncbi:GH1 family beta-glucosidase [Roseateles puraquae]|uniref:Beta-glucosidase n=1 Tax=Roseateles puraquae TaxID=431059 RepID=A0A254N3W4_9BURK|nr:GH1 family beta-glucosidase [Roseateles puraquae]MDG0853740.1 beta-glucosidase [Roseateles puraquae]OWR02785.1 beta-glucosidase [Roseateles puraquae]